MRGERRGVVSGGIYGRVVILFEECEVRDWGGGGATAKLEPPQSGARALAGARFAQETGRGPSKHTSPHMPSHLATGLALAMAGLGACANREKSGGVGGRTWRRNACARALFSFFLTLILNPLSLSPSSRPPLRPDPAPALPLHAARLRHRAGRPAPARRADGERESGRKRPPLWRFAISCKKEKTLSPFSLPSHSPYSPFSILHPGPLHAQRPPAGRHPPVRGTHSRLRIRGGRAQRDAGHVRPGRLRVARGEAEGQ